MKIYCTPDFKSRIEKLSKNKSYKNINTCVGDHFFLERNENKFKNGSNLNSSQKFPFIKARLEGSGGYRVYYYYYFIMDERIYLSYIHPKTGSKGISNIGNKFKSDLIANTAKHISENKLLFELKYDNNTLTFHELNVDEG